MLSLVCDARCAAFEHGAATFVVRVDPGVCCRGAATRRRRSSPEARERARLMCKASHRTAHSRPDLCTPLDHSFGEREGDAILANGLRTGLPGPGGL